MADETPTIGEVIAGRYRLERLLGHGGMGSVWLAHHLALGTDVAIKFLEPSLSRREDIRSRFKQEATAAARLRSPHVVGILDHGFDGERGYIAMERLRGEDLAARLDRVGVLDEKQTADFLTQACRGLAKAHATGIIHRDLKPANLFLVDDDDAVIVKILDFGIAKAVDPNGAAHKTGSGQVLGTPLYMSPEQALGRPLDARSDLYSLAVVAYRCLTGRTPFVSEAVGELIVAISTEKPAPPSRFNPRLSPAIDTWFRDMFLKDPEARPNQTARELADSFTVACAASSIEDQAIIERRAVEEDAETLPSIEPHALEAAVTARQRRSRLVGAAAVLLVAGLGIGLTQRAQDRPPSTTPDSRFAVGSARIVPVPLTTPAAQSPSAEQDAIMNRSPSPTSSSPSGNAPATKASSSAATVRRKQPPPGAISSALPDAVRALPSVTPPDPSTPPAASGPSEPAFKPPAAPSDLDLDRTDPWGKQ